MTINLNPKNMTHEDAVNLANQIERIEAGLKQMKESLKQYCVQNDTCIETETSVWDFYPSVSWSFSPEAKKRMAMDLAVDGTNPWEILSYSSSDLAKTGWDTAVLKNYGEAKIRNSFRSKKR